MKILSKEIFNGIPSDKYPDGLCNCMEPVEGDSNHAHIHTTRGIKKVCIGDTIVKYSDGTFGIYKKIEGGKILSFMEFIDEITDNP